MRGLGLAPLLVMAVIVSVTMCDCHFEAFTLLDSAEVLECMRRIEVSDSDKNSLFTSMQPLIDMYAFTDMLLDPPSPYEELQVDLRAELTALQEAPYASEYDMHKALAQLIAACKDPHLRYVTPYKFRQFSYIHPVRLTASLDEQGDTVLSMAMPPAEYAWSVTAHVHSLFESDPDAASALLTALLLREE
ncbi:hypothetical protein KIPB_009802, partial [Kipferlia bialata]|eukprot:g9802.t1